jgi:hypothetical protein
MRNPGGRSLRPGSEFELSRESSKRGIQVTDPTKLQVLGYRDLQLEIFITCTFYILSLLINIVR